MIFADRVKETSTTTGTGTLNLAGASTGFQTFVAGVGSGSMGYYCIFAGSEWEVGIGEVTAGSPDTLSRLTVLSSSNAGTLVNFSAGTKDVFVTIPAKRILSFPTSKPASSTAFDDEFESVALAAKWTTVTSPDGTFTVDPDYNDSFLMMKSLGHATANQLVIRQAITTIGAAGTAIGITAKLGLSAYTGSCITDFLVSDNTAYAAGNYVLFSVVQVTGDYKFQIYDGATLVDVALGPYHGTLYVHIQRTTGNIMKAYISSDGISWRRVYSGSKTFNIDYQFFRLYGSTTAAEPSEHLVDFIRYNDSRFTQQV